MLAPQGSISLAPSLDKAFEARDLVMAHKLQNSLKFVRVVPGVDHGQLPEGVVSMVLPVTAGNGFAGPGIRSTRFEKFACVTLGKERPVLPTGLVQEVKNAPPKVEFGALRFHVPRTFLTNEQWVSWSRNPGSMVLLWLGDTTLIHSSYGWAVTAQTNRDGNKEEHLVGYAKVQTSKLETVTAKSGRNGIFCDRLAKDRNRDCWVDWHDIGSHDPAGYLASALNSARLKANDLGVPTVPIVWRAGGGNCLGLELNQRPAASVVTWRAKSVPMAWTEDDLFSVLKEAGWTELAVVAYPTRKVRPWLLKCKAPVSVDRVAGVCHESSGVMIIMERAGPTGPASRNFKKVDVRPRVARPAASIQPTAIDVDEENDENEDLGVPPGQVEATVPDTPMSGDEGTEGGVKRVGASPPSQPPRTRAKTGPSPKKLVFPGFAQVDCGADGSCGYNCIAVGTAVMRGAKLEEVLPARAAMGATLRVQVATHIIKHEKDYKPMFSPDVSAATVERGDGDIPTCWSSWLTAICRHKRWICGLTIKAAAARLGVQVIVVLRAKDGWGNPMAIGEPKKKKKKETPVILGLNEAEGHYTLLIPNSPTDVPASWLMAAQLDHFTSQNALRGAGGEVSGNWLPSATPSKDSSRGVRSRASSSRFWLPKATPSKSKAMSSAARTLPTKRPPPAEEANVEDVEEFFEPFAWTCGICQLQLTAHSRPARVLRMLLRVIRVVIRKLVNCVKSLKLLLRRSFFP